MKFLQDGVIRDDGEGSRIVWVTLVRMTSEYDSEGTWSLGVILE